MGLDTIARYSCVSLYQFLTSEIKQMRDFQYSLLQTKHILIFPQLYLLTSSLHVQFAYLSLFHYSYHITHYKCCFICL